MIKINGNKYKLILVDTNIIHSVLSKKQNIHTRFIEFLGEHCIYCFSVITIVELHKWPEILEQFMKFVEQIPVIIFKDSNEVLRMEKDNFPDTLSFESIIDFSTESLGSELSAKLYEYTQSVEFLELKSDLVNIQKNKIEEFKETKALFDKYRFTKNDINWIISTSIRNKYNIDINKEEVSTQKGMITEVIRNYIQCYKYIVRKKIIEASDAFDLLILSFIPYVDIVITENSNAATLRLIKSDHDIINELSILTMKNIRGSSI